MRPFFDIDFYRSSNPDIVGSDLEIIYQFNNIGWKEGRDPSPGFSVSYYLGAYPDISNSGANPFLHYILFGKKEGRRPRGDEPLRLSKKDSAIIVPQHLLSILNVNDRKNEKSRFSSACDLNSLKIHWIIPDFSKGSGGHMTIFRTIRFLELFGHKCKIWIENSTFHANADDAWDNIIKYFQCVEAEVDFVENGFFQSSGDVIVATGWSTAYLVNKTNGYAEKFYFVQDHEPEFYPTGAEFLLAKQTYSFDLSCVCASPWLSELMETKYGRWARSFDLAYDPSIYKLMSKRDLENGSSETHEILKIAVYARDHTARRCVSLALIALQELGCLRQDFEVHFFGQETLSFNEVNFNAFNHGIVDSYGLAQIYNNCDIGVCFSATNYSLVPQEMMACGLPLVELNSESTRKIFPDAVVTLAGPDPSDIASKINGMMNSPSERKSQSQAALKWVNQFSWELSARKVEAAMKEKIISRREHLFSPSVSSSKEIRLDVVVPTFNGINEIKHVIDSLRRQRDKDITQIYCIDSSSSDGTTEWLRGQPDVSLTVIPQDEFQHGRTRNLGAALGEGKFISYLTQDAIPANDSWASDILMMFGHNPRAAGLFGRHLPYPTHPIIVQEEILNHFDNMLKYPLRLSRHTDELKWSQEDVGWRMLLHFYSDNNSAMRRDVWEKINYPEVEYGEDQIWARDIIEEGYIKIYAPTVCVYHSHDYNAVETYKRSKVEGHFFRKHFGYKLGSHDECRLVEVIAIEQRHFSAWAKRKKYPLNILREGC